MKDFLEPDRVLIGVDINDDSEHARSVLEKVYRPLTQQGVPLLCVDIRTAELTKYAANMYLATKIAFINEMSDLCEAENADIMALARGIGLDHRIGKGYLNPGPGFGGSCFPKDTRALRKMVRDAEINAPIVEAVVEGNETRKRSMAHRIISASGGDVHGKRIAILGLAFKANTDDIRFSPAISIINGLSKAGAKLALYDPEAMSNAHAQISGDDLHWAENAEDAINGSDIVVIVTEWEEFANLDWQALKKTMNNDAPIVIDLRNILDIGEMAGFDMKTIGKAGW